MSLNREGATAFPRERCKSFPCNLASRVGGRPLVYTCLSLALLGSQLLRAETTVPELSVERPAAESGGFGGIPWGASAETIEEKFGEAAERDTDSCGDQVARAALADEGYDCVVVNVERYVLDGIPFAASFRFDPHSKGLAGVILTSRLKSRNLDARAVKKMQSECRQSYEKVAKQLSQAFSSPVLPHQAVEKPAEPFTKGIYRAWETGDTAIRLRRSFGYTEHWRRWRRADGCEIEVRYAAVPPEEVSSAE
jgi:hypothetical protein